MSAVSTNYGSTAINVEVYDTVNGRSAYGYGVGSQQRSQQRSLRSIGNSYPLDSAKRRKQNGRLESTTRGEYENKKNFLFRPDRSFSTTVVSHEPKLVPDTNSKGSNESTRMIITKERDYSVQIEETQ
jgi:hypothetical protein